MLKNSSIKIYDQNSDTSLVHLRKYVSLLENKDFANDVWELGNTRLTEKKQNKKFALPELNKFPVDNKQEVILSKVYFDAQRHLLDEEIVNQVADRLDAYIDLYNIPNLFARKEQVLTKHADFTARYLLPSANMHKVSTIEELVKTGEYFDTNVHNYTLEERVEFSKEFVKVATFLPNVDLPKSVQTYCGLMDTDFDSLTALLGIRKIAAQRIGKSGEEYEKLAHALNNIEHPSKKELTKLAETIYGIDKKYGFDSEKYERRMPDAYGVVFNTPKKNKLSTQVPELSKEDIIATYGIDALEAIEDSEGNIDVNKLEQLVRGGK